MLQVWTLYDKYMYIYVNSCILKVKDSCNKMFSVTRILLFHGSVCSFTFSCLIATLFPGASPYGSLLTLKRSHEHMTEGKLDLPPGF